VNLRFTPHARTDAHTVGSSFRHTIILMKTLKKSALLTLAATVICALLVTGCNTMRGLGQDTERAGEKIQEKATR
jgi:predicted small secreted protein